MEIIEQIMCDSIDENEIYEIFFQVESVKITHQIPFSFIYLLFIFSKNN